MLYVNKIETILHLPISSLDNLVNRTNVAQDVSMVKKSVAQGVNSKKMKHF